ncbi:MAG: hypothetical protein AAGF27_08355 [Pseudomonadota bacterium]
MMTRQRDWKAGLDLAFIGALGLFLSASTSIAQAEGEIVMRPALEVEIDGTPWYKLSFSYDFGTRETVFMDAIGPVRGRGAFEVFSPTPEIRFTDPQSREVLAVATAENPTRLMSGSAFEFPALDAYSVGYTKGRWSGPGGFADHLIDTLNAAFPKGYRAYAERGEHYVATSYADLEPATERIIVQMALLVAHPGTVDAADFRVHVTARERRSHSGWRAQLSPQTEALVSEAVQGLISGLQGTATN